MTNEQICEFFARIWSLHQTGELGFEATSFKAIKKGTVPGAFLNAAAAHLGLVVLTEKGEKDLIFLWNIFTKREFGEERSDFADWDEFYEWAKNRSN